MVGMIVMWLQNSEKLLIPSRSACSTVIAVRRHRRLEAEREEDDLACPGFSLASSARRAANRPCARRRLRLLACSRLFFEPGTRIASPKVVKITSGRLGQRHAIVDAPHRQHADRAAGAVHQLDRVGQHGLDAVAENRVRVPAAHLHDLQRAVLAAMRAWRRACRSRAGALAPSPDRGIRRHISWPVPSTRARTCRCRGRRPAGYAPGPRGRGRWRRGIPGCGGCCRSRRRGSDRARSSPSRRRSCRKARWS